MEGLSRTMAYVSMEKAVASMRHLVILNAFHKGSHAAFAESLAEMLRTTGRWRVEIWQLPGTHWKWRMQGAASHFAQRVEQRPIDDIPDVWLTTDMMDVSRFLGMLSKPFRSVPVVQFFHENQLTYPWSANDPDVQQRIDLTYGMTNVVSALSSDAVWFNSAFHRDEFMRAAEHLMSQMPDAHVGLERLSQRSQVMSMPLDLPNDSDGTMSSVLRRPLNPPIHVLWNHRWAWDKAPDRFLEVLRKMKKASLDCRLILMGPHVDDPNVNPFHRDLESFSELIIHRGTAKSKKAYHHWLASSDVLIHEPRQEFFGISVLEAMFHGVLPIVPNRGPYSEFVPSDMLTDEPIATLQKLMKKTPNQISQLRRSLNESARQFSWRHLCPIWETELYRIASSS